MKKALLLLLTLLMALSLAACGTAAPRLERVPFEPIVVADQEDYQITITDISVSGRCGVTFLLENRGDGDLGLSVNGYVNGIYFPMVNWETEKQAASHGEQVEIFLEFLNYGEFSVGAMTNVELLITPSLLTEENVWWYQTDEPYTVQIYPYGEENAAVYEYVPKESHRVLVDNEYMTVIAVGYTSLSDSKLYFCNHTDRYVMLSVADDYALLNESVEGSARLHSFVPAGAHTFDLLFPVWPGQEMEGVHEYIKTDMISFALELVDMYTQEVLYTSDTITLSPSGIKVAE